MIDNIDAENTQLLYTIIHWFYLGSFFDTQTEASVRSGTIEHEM